MSQYYKRTSKIQTLTIALAGGSLGSMVGQVIQAILLRGTWMPADTFAEVFFGVLLVVFVTAYVVMERKRTAFNEANHEAYVEELTEIAMKAYDESVSS